MNIKQFLSIACFCTLSLATTYEYDPFVAKSLMNFSSLAYCTKNQLNGRPLANGVEYLHQHDSVYDLLDQTISYSIFADNNNKTLVFSFRGTQYPPQLIEEGLSGFSTVEFDLYKIPGAYIMDFFYYGYLDHARDDFLAQYKNLTQQYKGYKIAMTGHSLGAALTTIAAVDLIMSGLATADNLILYNYGCPRLATSAFIDKVEEIIPNRFRVVHYHDIVPRIPPCRFDDKKKECVKDPSYSGQTELEWPAYHMGPQVWYNKKSSEYQFCSNEDMKCSNSVPFYELSVMNHMNYFNFTLGC